MARSSVSAPILTVPTSAGQQVQREPRTGLSLLRLLDDPLFPSSTCSPTSLTPTYHLLGTLCRLSTNTTHTSTATSFSHPQSQKCQSGKTSGTTSLRPSS